MNVSDPLSFLPEDYLERKTQRRTNIICAVLAGIVMAAIGSAFSLTERMNQQAELRHAAVEQEYADAARRIQQVEQIERKQEQMARRAELASSLLEKIPRSNILAEITNCVPPDASLVEFDLASQRKTSTAQQTAQNAPPKPGADPPPPEPIAYDVILRVSGIASNDVEVAEFIRRLSHSPLFKDVNLVISDQASLSDQNIRHFQIEMTLDGDADVRQLGTHAAGNVTVQIPGN